MSSIRNGEGKLMHGPAEGLEVDKCECGKNKFAYQEVCSECNSSLKSVGKIKTDDK
jgi:hypothetical protein